MAKSKNNKWIFSRKEYSNYRVKVGAIVKTKGPYWVGGKNPHQVPYFVGKKVGPHEMKVFGNKKLKIPKGRTSMLFDNETMHIRVK